MKPNNLYEVGVRDWHPNRSAGCCGAAHLRGTGRRMEQLEGRFKPTRSEVVGTGGVGLHEFLSEPVSYWLEEER